MCYHGRNIFSHVHFATSLQVTLVDLDRSRLFTKVIVREGADGLKQFRDIISPSLTINVMNMLVQNILVKLFASSFMSASVIHQLFAVNSESMCCLVPGRIRRRCELIQLQQVTSFPDYTKYNYVKSTHSAIIFRLRNWLQMVIMIQWQH